MSAPAPPAKVFGIGLNKTGTKTLAQYLRALGFRHRSYDSRRADVSPSFDLYAAGRIEELLDLVDDVDSAEDWPWPLLYRELDERYPDARFVLTVRESPERWYASLCNMAVRIGPLPLYEQTVYGSAMPHGRREEHLRIYREHNRDVEAYFAGRPGKLLTVCWERGDDGRTLADFLGIEGVELPASHENPSPARGVYRGDNLWLAQIGRVGYQHVWGRRSRPMRLWRRVDPRRRRRHPGGG